MRLADMATDGPPSLVFEKDHDVEDSLRIPGIEAPTVAEVRMLRSHLQEL